MNTAKAATKAVLKDVKKLSIIRCNTNNSNSTTTTMTKDWIEHESLSTVCSKSPFLMALVDNHVRAEVIDIDHYRIRGGMAVETDYILSVRPEISTTTISTPTTRNTHKNRNHNHNHNHNTTTTTTHHFSSSTTTTTKKKIHHFDSFTISKTYSAFRSFASSLEKAADMVMSTASHRKTKTDPGVEKVAKYCDHIVQLIESQKTRYLGKVNYKYVKALAKKRSHVINDTLEALLTGFPNDIDSHPFLAQVAATIETFFLTDHVELESSIGPHSQPAPTLSNQQSLSPKDADSDRKSTRMERQKSDSLLGVPQLSQEDFNTTTNRPFKVPVEPFTRKLRRNITVRTQDVDDLESVGTEATLLLDDDRVQTELAPSFSKPVPTYKSAGTRIGNIIENNPLIFVGIALASITLLQKARQLSVTMDLDVALLIFFACFCVGLHTPRPLPGGQPSDPVPVKFHTSRSLGNYSARGRDRVGARLLRQSMRLTSPNRVLRQNRSSIGHSGHMSCASLDESTQSNYTYRRGSALSTTASGRLEDPASTTEQVTTTNKGEEPLVGELHENILLEEESEDEDSVIMAGPMERYPEGAELGTHYNCWSEPEPNLFSVRGANYLTDRKKIPSQLYLFPVRGVDLFLTDTAPENVASNSSVFGGQLRDVPTFVVNFRLPWGILLFYYEIPSHLVPYLKAGYFDPSVDRDDLTTKMDTMSPANRTAARWLMGTDEHRNATLKIVPRVAQGPWVVKSVVGGKPAIIGNKLPVTYVYQPEERRGTKTTKALYLEADLDIVSSSAARGILSVTRTYTQVLTLDMGFVIQGNTADELPECMLVGTRLHGIDPVTAPPLPPMKNNALLFPTRSDDDGATPTNDDDSATERVF